MPPTPNTGPIPPLTAFANQAGGIHVLVDDGERVLCRGSRENADGSRGSVLVVLLAGEPPSTSSLERLARECEFRDDLDDAWAVRPLELGQDRARTLLVLEDPGGEPLERSIGAPMEMQRFLRLATCVAAALGNVHRRGLVHKDVRPANILIDCRDGQVRLTGFGVASRVPRERQAPEPPETIAGTLTHMAPEQTGRMNRSIDARSDLYALGITFYQMLTGTLPFAASDPMGWVHCHIARRPIAPAERVKETPLAVSAIVMKLLAKTAEDRYQTAAGLERDLRRCLAEWDVHGEIGDFPLGQHDTSDRLLIPEKLYGRESEVETLLDAFDRVVQGGNPELVLVSGYSGVGKSSVVHELHKVLVPPRGLFASGKFDQYKRDIPYATLAQAFQDLVRGLLAKSKAELKPWRDALREALGPHGGLVVDLVPELRLVIGDQPPIPALEPQQAQARFQLVLRRFIGVFARQEHPLALFLDDLQWLDAATLDFIEDLLTRPDLRNLLFIGAYRDNEVDGHHPLMRKLAAIRNAGAKVSELTLEPLAREHVGQLIVDALGCDPTSAAPLSALVHGKTAGNPFFVIQFLQALAEEGLLIFDHDAARWGWSVERIGAKGHTNNVVELMVRRVGRLSAETREALQHLACLGNTVQTETLALVLDISEERVHAALWEAARLELVERRPGLYKFAHDRVQEAAYSLIPEALRAEAHLRIGRLLVAHTPPEVREESIFDIVNQLNRGAALIASQDERAGLAELNLIAGRRAKSAAAYASALGYFVAGASLLTDDCWEHRHEHAFALELNRAECEFLTGAQTASEERTTDLASHTQDRTERATLASLRMDIYITLGQSARAVEVALDFLRDAGTEWSPHPSDAEAQREYDRVRSLIGSRTVADLLDLPLMTDPFSLATLDVLTKLVPAALFTDANLYCLACCKAVGLSLERGYGDGSCPQLEWLGLVAGTRFGDYQAGILLGQVGYDLVEQRGLQRFEARTYMLFGAHVIPWARNLHSSPDVLRRAFDAANKSGDVTFAQYSLFNLTSVLLATGEHLAEVQREAESSLEFATKVPYNAVIDIMSTQLALTRTLRGLTREFGAFDDHQFDESRIEARFAGQSDSTPSAICWYWIRKLQARFFSGDFDSAIDALSNARQLVWATMSMFEWAEYHFYGALARAAACDRMPSDERRQVLDDLAIDHRQLKTWAESCSENFENRAALVGAEIARLEGRPLEAMDLYEQAIRSAKRNGFVHSEALAYELAGQFHAARGFETISHAYLRNARDGYARWGADGKVRQLEEIYPHLMEERGASNGASALERSIEHLDLATVTKMSQALSGEIVLDNLLDTVMRTALEQAGAERSVLVLSSRNEPRVAAEAAVEGNSIVVRLHDGPMLEVALPESVLHYVVHTNESVILDDAAAQNPFSADPYILQHRARSILCLPLLNQGQLKGVLYLENNLARGVFAPSRITVLRLLASQAAAALENVQLYRDVEQREAMIRRLVDANIIGIFFWSSDGRILEANDAFLRMVGFNREDLLTGRIHWTELTPPDWLERDTLAIEEAKATGAIQPYEKEYFRRDGSRVPVLLGAATFEENGTRGVAFVLDLTARKRAEAALRESEEQWKAVFENNPTMYFMVDPGGTILSVNSFGAEQLGFRVDELIGRPVQILLHETDREYAARNKALCLEHVGRTISWELRKLRKDGEALWVRETARAMLIENRPVVLIVSEDITEGKRAADALREVQAELAHANRLAAMGQLTASIAHEVNQPIGAMVTDAQAALRFLDGRPPDLVEVREALASVVKGGFRARDVISRIRALVQKAPPRTESVDINEAIREVIVVTRGEAAKNGISVEAQLVDGLPLIQGDRVQLQQVILNLILNAIEAMSGDDSRPRKLSIGTEQGNPDGVLVAVRDSGPGIDPECVECLFESFYTTKSNGMGMGLSICRSIVEAHGGLLWAGSNRPDGAVFQFTLPKEAVTAS